MRDDLGQLETFIASAKERGVDDAFLVALLRQNGWSERRVYAAFSSYYGHALGAPVPSRGRGIEYARDAFSYVLAFIALGAWTVAVGHLFFVLIDRWLPSGLDAVPAESIRYDVAGELATIIVAFPVFVLVSRAIAQGLARRPESADSGVRAWLTYCALVVASIVLIGDCVWFLASFLQGDLTGRFVLKSCVVVLLAGGVFWYYLSTVRAEAVDVRWNRAFGAAACVAVAAALVLGFFDIGSPQHARAVAADERRLSDLRAIANAIHASRGGAPATRRIALPRSLNDVHVETYARDPETDAPYAYAPGAGAGYRLCATFQTEDRSAAAAPLGHPAGAHCFALDATREY
jgi:hypothetical protein